MRKLTEKKYWSSNYRKPVQRIAKSKLVSVFRKSFYRSDLLTKLKPYMPQHGSILEVGCAPGHNLIYLADQLALEPFGVEYTHEGVRLTKSNFRSNHYPESNVMHADFFSSSFQKKGKGCYDVVSSFGFIEHFNYPKKVLAMHASLLKKGGILVIGIPNLKHLNKHFVEKKILDKHNLKIMDLSGLKMLCSNAVTPLLVSYYGGPCTLGLYFFSNKVTESIRIAFFVVQRITMDPVLWLLSKIGIDLNNKYLSPGLILIAIKK